MKEDPLKIAEEIADRAEVRWADGSDRHPLVKNLRRIAAIADAYHLSPDASQNGAPESGSSGAEPGPKKLFEWGHLQVIAPIAKGNFGEVYRAFDPALEREVALKLRHPESFSMPSWSYIQEARRLARVRHPNVLAIHGAGTHNGRVGLWCDLIQGDTLGEKLRRDGPFEFEPALVLALGLAEALASVHRAGIVHCDIKSSNVMLDADGRVVLMDFGAGNDARQNGRKKEMSFGTPLYMAPELFKGQSAQTPCDIYSFGVLLFQTLTNRFPIEAKTLPEIIYQHETGRYLALNKLRPGLPKPLVDLVHSCLASDPDARPKAEELVKRLQWIVEIPDRKLKQRLRLGLIAVLCLGILVSSWGYFKAKRETARTRQAQVETQAIHDFLTDVLAAPAPAEKGRNIKVLDVLDDARSQIEPKFGQKPRLKASIMYTLGRTFGRLAEFAQAEELLTASLELYTDNYGGEDPRTLQCRVAMAEVLLKSGKISEAEIMFPLLLDQCLEVLGTSHYITGNCAILYALVHERRTRLAEAESLLLQVFEWRRALVIDDDHCTRLAMHHLGNVYMAGGKYGQAEPLLRELTEWQIQAAGLKHPNTISVRVTLATALVYQGKLKEAETILRENLAVAREVFGPSQDRVTAIQSNLAFLLGDMGKSAEALAQIDELLLIVKEKPVLDEGLFINLKIGQANALRELGRTAEAEAVLRECIPADPAFSGETDPNSGILLYNLAEILIETGRCEEGETFAQRARDFFARVLGVDHHFTLEASDLFGACLFQRGQIEEAIAIHERVLAGKEKILAENSAHFLNTLKNLVSAYRASGRTADAAKVSRKYYEIHRNLYGEENEKTRLAKAELAKLGGQ